MLHLSHCLLEAQDRPSPDEGRMRNALSAIHADLHSHSHCSIKAPVFARLAFPFAINVRCCSACIIKH